MVDDMEEIIQDQPTSLVLANARHLTDDEINLLNEIAAEGERIFGLCIRVNNFLANAQAGKIASATANPDPNSPEQQELNRFNMANPGKWIDTGTTHLKEGLMGLTRAVAQPLGF